MRQIERLVALSNWTAGRELLDSQLKSFSTCISAAHDRIEPSSSTWDKHIKSAGIVRRWRQAIDLITFSQSAEGNGYEVYDLKRR